MLNNNEDMAVLCYISGYIPDKAYKSKKYEDCQLFLKSKDKIVL